jgi:hypothetical protein
MRVRRVQAVTDKPVGRDYRAEVKLIGPHVKGGKAIPIPIQQTGFTVKVIGHDRAQVGPRIDAGGIIK